VTQSEQLDQKYFAASPSSQEISAERALEAFGGSCPPGPVRCPYLLKLELNACFEFEADGWRLAAGLGSPDLIELRLRAALILLMTSRNTFNQFRAFWRDTESSGGINPEAISGEFIKACIIIQDDI